MRVFDRSIGRLGRSTRRWSESRDAQTARVLPAALIATISIGLCIPERGFGLFQADLGRGWALASTAAAAIAESGAAGSHAGPALQNRFRAFLAALYPQAAKLGIDRATFALAFQDMTPDPEVARAAGRQSEFARPFSAYFNGAVAPRRIAQGRRLAVQWHTEIEGIAHRFGVPGPVLLAVWAMESDFGRATGAKDVIRSLATLAFLQPERPLFRKELLDALVMLQKGAVSRSKMKGSWAGAMGGPQFLPSTYLTYAASYSGHSEPDIWTNVPDILASIGNFLKASGWKRGARWGYEVSVPVRFDYATLRADFREWAALGFKPVAVRTLPRSGEAMLFFPAGAKGPAFLLGSNYWVLKTYNNSDAYALSLGCLADRIGGGSGLRTPWPRGEKLWRRSEKAEIQRLLHRLGYYNGTIDGRFGPSSRDAIHAFQLAIGDQPADGVGGADLLAKLREKAGK